MIRSSHKERIYEQARTNFSTILGMDSFPHDLYAVEKARSYAVGLLRKYAAKCTGMDADVTEINRLCSFARMHEKILWGENAGGRKQHAESEVIYDPKTDLINSRKGWEDSRRHSKNASVIFLAFSAIVLAIPKSTMNEHQINTEFKISVVVVTALLGLNFIRDARAITRILSNRSTTLRKENREWE
jgi:hypothetical protein